MLANSGRFTARFAAVALSTRMGGVSFPLGSTCVRYNCVYGDRLFDEKAIQRPFGEKVCHEFISGVLHFISRASPPSEGTIWSFPSGRITIPFRASTNTIQRPSEDTFGKLLLIPFPEAPRTRSA